MIERIVVDTGKGRVDVVGSSVSFYVSNDGHLHIQIDLEETDPEFLAFAPGHWASVMPKEIYDGC